MKNLLLFYFIRIENHIFTFFANFELNRRSQQIRFKQLIKAHILRRCRDDITSENAAWAWEGLVSDGPENRRCSR